MNLIPKIVDMLGFEIGEEFKVEQDGMLFGTYKFEEDGLKAHCNGAWVNAEKVLYYLIVGDLTAKKIPYEPKPGEEFFYVSTTHPMSIGSATWVGDDCTIECAFKYCGNVFRTEAEAEKQKYEVYERITGKKWGHDND